MKKSAFEKVSKPLSCINNTTNTGVKSNNNGFNFPCEVTAVEVEELKLHLAPYFWQNIKVVYRFPQAVGSNKFYYHAIDKKGLLLLKYERYKNECLVFTYFALHPESVVFNTERYETIEKLARKLDFSESKTPTNLSFEEESEATPFSSPADEDYKNDCSPLNFVDVNALDLSAFRWDGRVLTLPDIEPLCSPITPVCIHEKENMKECELCKQTRASQSHDEVS